MITKVTALTAVYYYQQMKKLKTKESADVWLAVCERLLYDMTEHKKFVKK